MNIFRDGNKITFINTAFITMAFFSALGQNRTRDPRVPEPKRTPLGYILPEKKNIYLG
jgi:hypothetical protein